MLKGSDLIGSHIAFHDDERQEQVAGLMLDIPNNSLIGFLISRGGWKGGAQILLWEDITDFQPGLLIVEQCSPIIDVGKVMQAKEVLERQEQLIGLRVLTSSGQQLGRIIDFYCDKADGVVTGVVTSGRTDSDEANIYVPIFDSLTTGDGFAIATPEMVGAAHRIETS